VKQDGDMRGRQSEHFSDVFAGDLVQHPQRNDRTLHLPEGIEAPNHEREILRLGYQLVDRLRVSGEEGEGLVARIMGVRDRVPAASIPRVVPHQSREQLDRIIVRSDQLPGLGQQKKSMEFHGLSSSMAVPVPWQLLRSSLLLGA
jgi:hypothetical protein